MTMAQRSGHLSGWRLTVLRALWTCAAVLFTLLFILSLPQEVEQGRQGAVGWLEIALEAYFLALALFIFWQRSDDWIACILSLALMMALTTDNLELIAGSGPLVQQLDLVLAAISSTLLLGLFYVFPDGRFVPRWTRWAAAALIGLQIWRLFFEDLYDERGLPVIGLLFLMALVAQIYRYFRVSDPVQRQQIKWVVFGLAVTVPPIGLVLVFSAGQNFPEPGTYAERLGYFFWVAFLVILPLSITVSLLRYRLWDIDVIIRKTVVYGSLTGLLTLLYFGSVVLLQRLFEVFTGQRSPVVIVISTLLIAALSSPLRRRLQRTIDRRFFRQKYDAAQMLAAFAQTARDEVELEKLTAELIRVVEETMQPEQVLLWLKPMEKKHPASLLPQESTDGHLLP
jgi:hypothetical protein